jgi:hypothetical protein
MVSGHADTLQRGTMVAEMGNAAPPVLNLLCGEDEGVELLKADRLMKFGGWGCGGERVRAHQSGRRQWWLGSPLRENERGWSEVRRQRVAWAWFFPSLHRQE